MISTYCMKRLLFIILISHLAFLSVPSQADAHTLKTDGTVGAVLHVSPDDDPVAGVNTDFFFELKDTKNVVTPENCECIATVIQNGKEIYSQSLFQTNASPSLEDASFSYVLPQKDLYTIQITGKPNNGTSFAPFTLSWDLRVARDSTNNAPESGRNLLVTAFPIVVAFAAIILFVRIVSGKKKRSA